MFYILQVICMHILLNNNVLNYSKYISYFELLFYKYKNRMVVYVLRKLTFS